MQHNTGKYSTFTSLTLTVNIIGTIFQVPQDFFYMKLKIEINRKRIFFSVVVFLTGYGGGQYSVDGSEGECACGIINQSERI